MIYGYARISTAKQSIERQIRNIVTEYPTAVIIEDKYTGTQISRPNFDKLLKTVVQSDTIVFDSVSRMSRNAEEGFSLYEELYNRGIELVFLKEPQINTSTYKSALNNAVPMTGTSVDFILEGVNKYLMSLAREQIRLAFEQSEKEVADLHQRTREGIITAKSRGKQIGQLKGAKLTTRKSIEAKKVIREHHTDFGGTLNNDECQKLAGISRNTLFKYKSEITAERDKT